jgi:hypothetical protein
MTTPAMTGGFVSGKVIVAFSGPAARELLASADSQSLVRGERS